MNLRTWRSTLLLIYDFGHFQLRVGDIPHVTFEWWWLKFHNHVCRKTALRHWERTKAKIRDSELEVEWVTLPQERHGNPQVAIKIPKETMETVEALLDSFQHIGRKGSYERGSVRTQTKAAGDYGLRAAGDRQDDVGVGLSRASVWGAD